MAERFKPSPEQERIDQLSPLARDYILLRKDAASTKDFKKKYELSDKSLLMYETELDHAARSEVQQFGHWWQEQIKARSGKVV